MKQNVDFRDEIIRLDHSYFPWPWKSEDFISFFLNEESYFSAILVEKKVKGFLMGHLDYGLAQFHLYKILIDPKYRGQGLARSITQGAGRELYSLGIREIYLEVEVDNHHAIALYESFGLKIIHRKKGFYSNGKDAFIMLGGIDLNLFH